MTHNEALALLQYLESKGFLAGSLTADLVMSVLEDEAPALLSEVNS